MKRAHKGSYQVTAEDAVVHLYVYCAKFNWAEPYKIREQTQSMGTGFFIDQEGHIVTTAHVVLEAWRIEVRLPSMGHAPLYAELVGISPERDLALLKLVEQDRKKVIDLCGLIPTLPLGDSDHVERSEPVLVLGYPLGQYNLKGSTGIVSGREPILWQTVLQITAPVNPGNSGAPVINQKGEVIGITQAVTPQAANMGYAIPSNDFRLIAAQLNADHALVRLPNLGLMYAVTTDQEAHYLGNPVPGGLYVCDVIPDSISARAGVQEGDMIYEMSGFSIDSYGSVAVSWAKERVTILDLLVRLAHVKKNSIVVYRKGSKLVMPFSFDEEVALPIRQVYPDYESVDYEIVAGMVLMELTENHVELLAEQNPALACYERAQERHKQRVVISYVIPVSMADDRESFAPGHVIASLNDKAIKTIADVRKALMLSLETGVVTCKTQEHIFGAFPLQQMLEQAERFHKEFSYPITPAIRKLMK